MHVFAQGLGELLLSQTHDSFQIINALLRGSAWVILLALSDLFFEDLGVET
jgi:hypothetical protein